MPDELPKRKSKLKKIFDNTIVEVVIVIIFVLAIVVGIYALGYHNGERHQKNVDLTSHNPALGSSQNLLPFLQNRWTSVGTLKSVSSSSITIQNIDGQNQTAAINSTTIVTNPTAQSASISALKTGQKIIATGTKTSKGALTATRIRIE